MPDEGLRLIRSTLVLSVNVVCAVQPEVWPLAVTRKLTPRSLVRI